MKILTLLDKEIAMSIEGRSLIALSETQEYGPFRIHTFAVPECSENAPDGMELYSVLFGCKVLTYDIRTGKTHFKEIISVSVRRNVQRFKVTTSGGRSVIVGDGTSLAVYNHSTGVSVPRMTY